MADTKTRGKPRKIKCQETGKEFDYIGYGRPPRYHPDVKAAMDAKNRRIKADAKRAAATAAGKAPGKKGRPSKAPKAAGGAAAFM